MIWGYPPWLRKPHMVWLFHLENGSEQKSVNDDAWYANWAPETHLASCILWHPPATPIFDGYIPHEPWETSNFWRLYPSWTMRNLQFLMVISLMDHEKPPIFDGYIPHEPWETSNFWWLYPSWTMRNNHSRYIKTMLCFNMVLRKWW